MPLFNPNSPPYIGNGLPGVQPKNPCPACDKREREAAKADAHRWAVTAEDLKHMQEAAQGPGSLAGSMGVAQMARAPGKMFTRSDILAILRGQRAVAGNVADAEYERLLTIFSNIE